MDVLLTGACGGLGIELAKAFAQRGARLWLLDRDPAALTQLNQQLGGSHLTLAGDLTDQETLAELEAECQRQQPLFAWVLNNAGVASGGAFESLPDSEWQRCLDINLMASVRLSRLVSSFIGKGSYLVNIVSMAAVANAPYMAAYNVSKAALLSLSETLRFEWRPRGIQVSAVCPAFFQTPLLDSLNAQGKAIAAPAGKMMQRSELTAADVADYLIEHAIAGEFLILPHKKSRQAWRVKRWLPNLFFKQVLQQTVKGH